MNLSETARDYPTEDLSVGFRTMLPWFAYVLPALSVVLGGVFAFKSLSFIRESQACSRWPTVPGWVVRSQVNRTVDEDGEAELSNLCVLYTYRVNDQEYRSTRLYAGKPVLSGGSRVAEAMAAKYRTGSDVAVYYNPANPAVAMLEPLNLANAKVSNIAAIGFGGIGVLMIGMLQLVH